MARSLSIAAYVANLGSADRSGAPVRQPPRPDGTILWARCSDADQLTAVETLGRKIAAEGDPIHLIVTLRNWVPELSARALPEPHGKGAIRAFIAHWKPTMAIWVRGELDAALMAEISAAGINSILVDASADGLDGMAGRWVPGAMRELLSEFEAILALDQAAADKLIRAGAPEDTILVAGAMEDCAPTLPYDETERTELALAIGARPVWLAAAAQHDEWQALCIAHQIASRRTHRLLAIIVPANMDDAAPMADKMRQFGYQVALRSDQPEPSDVTQVYVVDTEEELGLCYRVAPMTYLGGTLFGPVCRDPFEAASLGSAVLYGPHVLPFTRHATRLSDAGAARLVRGETDLGATIESLLSVDKAAQMAHRAWDVTSQGANVTNRIAAFIQLRLEELVP